MKALYRRFKKHLPKLISENKLLKIRIRENLSWWAKIWIFNSLLVLCIKGTESHVLDTTFTCFFQPNVVICSYYEALLLKLSSTKLRSLQSSWLCEMAREVRSDELALVAYYDAAEKTRIEKITEEIMADLFYDSEDSE